MPDGEYIPDSEFSESSSRISSSVSNCGIKSSDLLLSVTASD